MDEREWAALGEAIRDARAEHERRATEALARRCVADVALLLDGRGDLDPLLGALAARLGEVTLDDWERIGSRDAAEPLALREAWRKLDDTWHWADAEAEPREDAHAWFLDGLREDLAPLAEAMRAGVAELAGAADRFAAAATLGLWPLEYVGQARALHAEALDAITERTGIPREEMLDVDSIEDEACFVLTEEAHAIEALGDALAARVAWARAAHRIGRR